MKIIDRGSGPPVVLVPGIQGRWEWMLPAVEALSKHCRVITFSLADEPTSGAAFDEATGFDCYLLQIGDALDAAGLASATICGISYGGLVAAAFAGRYPERTRGVVVVSAVAPSWRPDARVKLMMRAPRLLSPIFCINSLRLFEEMVVAKNGLRAALGFGLRHLAAVARHRFSPVLMARRVQRLRGNRLGAELAQMRLPALVITGQPELDRVMPVSVTQEYLRLWPHAGAATITRSGHLGAITRPDEFAALVARFAESNSGQQDERRRVVV